MGKDDGVTSPLLGCGECRTLGLLMMGEALGHMGLAGGVF